jgi:hypothetical protein
MHLKSTKYAKQFFFITAIYLLLSYKIKTLMKKKKPFIHFGIVLFIQEFFKPKEKILMVNQHLIF